MTGYWFSGTCGNECWSLAYCTLGERLPAAPADDRHESTLNRHSEADTSRVAWQTEAPGSFSGFSLNATPAAVSMEVPPPAVGYPRQRPPALLRVSPLGGLTTPPVTRFVAMPACSTRLRLGLLFAGCIWVAAGLAPADEVADSAAAVDAVRIDADAALTFERDIRPIFRAHCLDCHGAVEDKEGSLDLRLVRLMLQGGDSGPALEPGDAVASLLIDRIRSGEMPPGEGGVPEAEIELLEQWIAAGAPTARAEPETIGPGVPLLPEERQWWSFQPLVRPDVPQLPETSDPPATVDLAENAAPGRAGQPRSDQPRAGQPRTAIDALLQQSMPERLGFSADASRRDLMLRLYIDLIGLPPTAEQAEQFLSDDAPDAYERLVDQLLRSPHYGERWARHWLDIAGYADSDGRTVADAVRPWAYRYRDYVIQSLNDDKPLDQFLQEQLAGDELAGSRDGDWTDRQIELWTATGFLRMAADGTGSGENTEEARNQVVADTIKIVSSSLLGLSFACAQCHDHRYDPISHTDYFAMRAVFEPALDYKNWKAPNQRNVSLYTQAQRQQADEIEQQAQEVAKERAEKQARYIAEALDQELTKYDEPLRSELRAAFETPEKMRSDEQKAILDKHPSVKITPGVLYQYNQKAADDLKQDSDRIAEIRATKPTEHFISVTTEPAGTPATTYLFHRGDYRQPMQEVQPAAPAVLCAEDNFVEFPSNNDELPTSGRRLAYARWLTSDQNPITARVLANRVWMHLMGRGLVATPADFGKLGGQPTHPELLDYLAWELQHNGWSLKRLQRQIVLSTAYRQDSVKRDDYAQIDPDNQFYWRASVKRLDAEVIRDRLLVATGRLDETRFGPAIPVKLDETGQVIVDPQQRRRSIYIQQRRSQPVALMQAFDAPVMETNCEIRPASTVATQALMLMNSDFILDQARALAAQQLATAPSDQLLADAGLQLNERTTLQLDWPAIWQAGYGSVDADSGLTNSFTPLPHFEKGVWKGSAQTPDPAIGWAMIRGEGGHPGNNPDFAVIRRWTAPAGGTISLHGTLNHPSENGDGVQARLIANRPLSPQDSATLGSWIAQHGSSETTLSNLAVQAGDHLDLVVDCRDNTNADSYTWPFELTFAPADGSEPLRWTASQSLPTPDAGTVPLQVEHLVAAWQAAYCRPPQQQELELAVQFINDQCREMALSPRPLPDNIAASQQAFANLCQVLLTSNEFLYIR